MSNIEFSVKILQFVGGFDNISDMSNCNTRLRIDLKDLEKCNLEELKNLFGVIGVVPFGSQLQIVLGPQTQEVSDTIKSMKSGL